MDPRLIVPLPAQSPWSSWARPDIHHCEANLSGWVAAPADAWSNLAYLAAALWLWRRRDEPNARALAGIVFAIGVTSFLFHASYTFFFQVFDYGGMFLYSSWIIAQATRRAGWFDSRGSKFLFASLTAGSIAAVVVSHRIGRPVQPVFGIQALAAAGLEGWLYRRRTADYAIKPLAVCLCLVAAAFALWNFDHLDWFCRPDDHVLQGHALWHLLTAASFVPAFLYFRQF
ncbi:MAG: ceramidase domain-containing protein [Elusimicrobia bacterium]|nr:ceramidase domain-containing protein [Elusimicrobiota bacterium]